MIWKGSFTFLLETGHVSKYTSAFSKALLDTGLVSKYTRAFSKELLDTGHVSKYTCALSKALLSFGGGGFVTLYELQTLYIVSLVLTASFLSSP